MIISVSCSGHEIPLVIKLNWMRQTFNNKNQKTFDEYRQGCRCSFILRYRMLPLDTAPVLVFIFLSSTHRVVDTFYTKVQNASTRCCPCPCLCLSVEYTQGCRYFFILRYTMLPLDTVLVLVLHTFSVYIFLLCSASTIDEYR